MHDDARPISIARSDLEAAARQQLLPADGADALWRFLAQRRAADVSGPRFTFTHTLYYLGGLLAIGAATLFMTEGFQRLGPSALLVIAIVYAALCVAAARWLHGRQLEVPAGILATLAVCLAPLATWALQHALGLWPDGGPERYASYHTRIDWRWLTLEWVTLTAAAVALWALRYPFLSMPLAVTLWYLGMDLARLLLLIDSPEAWTFYRDFSLFYGLLMLLLAFWVDQRSRSRDAQAPGSRRDYAFWLYLLGMLSFWCALSSRESTSELAKAAYAALNLGFIALGAVLQRRVFTVCGALGVAGYLGYLSARVFKDSLLFPVALTAIGLAVIAAGLWWQQHEGEVRALLWRRLPPALRGWLPAP
ncbi:MAG: DUF2157 domain-containing protein [Rubrivivax sp.]